MTSRTTPAAVAVAALVVAAATGCTGGSVQGGGTPTPGISDRPPAAGRSAPPPSAAPGGASAPAGFTLVASGDVLPHDSIIRRAAQDAGGDGYDFGPMLAGAKSVVAPADLAICHMETVYGKEGGPYTGYPAFKSPPEVAAALKATGYDSCSTASNHTLDDGADGLRRTLDALDAAGIRHAGSARTAEEAARPTLMKAGGATVAQLAYTYDTNGYPLPEGQPWAVGLLDEGKVVADARAARAAGADVVVVSVHWGTEWQTAADERQLSLGRALTASTSGGRPDIDLIIGTHAHVPQAYEKVNGTWIVYGMGDQIAGDMINHEGAFDPRGNQGTLGRFTFAPPKESGARWEVTKAEFVPQWFDTGRGRVVNLGSSGDGDPRHTSIREAIRQVVLGRGAEKDGLTMGK
ncbi:Putative lipoprotein [Streptomyces venezuelae]|uniref:CapA family protein n=1 Tax=Streptomyces gardneri TaxID=66892 RepID=UPI0006BC1FA9|nr:CapA family protein [Streptomyces gardneri]ALO12675.1 Putative lipoprotein [Streptomyces venezuelae]QPK49400.1 CapA family protein [Streptomyces gardneri]WRK40934.1 CapA family protein [Streptomyces venezuelae]CUM36685.1 lipoprotein [Streptomyces venezuelae]